MIEASLDTDITFFEALAQVVRDSGLTQSEIVRRANRRLKAAHQRMLAQIQDPAERIFVDIAQSKDLYLHRSTLNRAVRAIDSISEKTLERIALGLDLDQGTLNRLKKLLDAEAYVHHSTQTRALVSSDGKGDQFPSWFYQE